MHLMLKSARKFLIVTVNNRFASEIIAEFKKLSMMFTIRTR